MARHRNWSARTWAEVYVRICLLDQSPYRVAKATGLTYMQVQHFAKQCTDTHLPTNTNIPSAEELATIRAEVEAQSAAEDAAAATTVRAPIDTAALTEEVNNCIDLCKQVAAQFGITPRHFLWLCSTSARSAV